MRLSTMFFVATTASMYGGAATAQSVIAYQSFEHEVAIAGNYIDPGSGQVSYNPTNLAGQPIIDSTRTSASAGSLGFDLTFVASRPNNESPGFSNGAEIGVKSDTTEGRFSHGFQGYKFSNPDGTMVLTFAPVDLQSFLDVTVSIDYFIGEAIWETSDYARIDVVTNEGINTILNTEGQNIDDLAIEGVWLTETARLPNTATYATLVVYFESGSPPETMYIDNIVFKADDGDEEGGGVTGTEQSCNDDCSGFFAFLCWIGCFINQLLSGFSSISDISGGGTDSFSLPLLGAGVGAGVTAAVGVLLLLGVLLGVALAP